MKAVITRKNNFGILNPSDVHQAEIAVVVRKIPKIKTS